MLNKNPDRRPGISQIVQTKLVSRYVKAFISYGRTVKFQLDDLKKGMEQIAAENAAEQARKDIAAVNTLVDDGKSKKDMPVSSSKSVRFKIEEKNAAEQSMKVTTDMSMKAGPSTNMLANLKKKREQLQEEEKKTVDSAKPSFLSPKN